MAKPSKTLVKPVCDNCKWSYDRLLGEMVVCGIDLPPHVRTSADPRHHTVYKEYSCAFHSPKVKPNVEQGSN